MKMRLRLVKASGADDSGLKGKHPLMFTVVAFCVVVIFLNIMFLSEITASKAR